MVREVQKTPVKTPMHGRVISRVISYVPKRTQMYLFAPLGEKEKEIRFSRY